VNPYLDKGLNEFQRLILFSQFLTIFGGIMFKLVESVDKLLESEETPSKRQERDIIAALIVAVNLVAIGIYPIYRMIAVASGFKGGVLLSQSYFSLRDTVQILMGGRAKENRSNVKFQEKSLSGASVHFNKDVGKASFRILECCSHHRCRVLWVLPNTSHQILTDLGGHSVQDRVF
jgi:hypothetical protein